MDASITLWENWREQVKELLPGVHGHQKKALALCVLGMILSQSAVLQRMAEGIALHGISEAKMPSIERRLARFVGNARVQASTIWKQFLSQVLAYWKGKQVRLVLDCTPFDDRATIVYLGLLVQSRRSDLIHQKFSHTPDVISQSCRHSWGATIPKMRCFA